MNNACLALALMACATSALAQSAPRIDIQQSGSTQRLQAVSPVSDVVVWASGTGGTFAVTTDGGVTWRAGRVPGFLQAHVGKPAEADLAATLANDDTEDPRGRAGRLHLQQEPGHAADGPRAWPLGQAAHV